MALDLSALGKPLGPFTRTYTWRDVSLYALGVGAGFDELDYVYEKRLKVLPSFSIGSVFDFLMTAAVTSNANLGGVLHGEQDIYFHAPIPPEGTITTTGAITRYHDKGDKGALVVAEADTVHESGVKLFTNVFTLFCRRDGGFGGEAAPKEAVEFPDRPPDHEERAHPSPDQPLLYRLSGDVFVLHVDPEFARQAGFERPIMHGLCTHGYACRAAVKHLMPGAPERMTRFRVRFSRTLYPGVPIVTQIWRVAEGRAVFRVQNAETSEVVIDGGIVEWRTEAAQARRDAFGPIHLDGQVAVVTGAGRGLGRAYALALAGKGARVVVNDLGGDKDGSGDGSPDAADAVVAEIGAAGGEAVASHASVATPEGGEAIVRLALDTWGRVDAVIASAGILRDRSLAKMSDEDWQQVLDVHLLGAFHVLRPAVVRMREQRYGRIVLVTSAAGLHGFFGQTSYAAAKLGLVGLMHSLALEGEKHNIKVNTVAPVAATRLTAGVFPDELAERLDPAFVAPLVTYLSSEQCPVTGHAYHAGMGFYGRAAVVTGPGATVGDGKSPPSAEQVAAAFERIRGLEPAVTFANLTASLAPVVSAFDPKAPAAGAPAAAGAATGAKRSVPEVLAALPGVFKPEAAAGVDVVFQFEVTGEGGGSWSVAIRDQACTITEGKHEKPTTTITLSAADFLAFTAGELKATKAYAAGKLKIGGDLMKSQLVEKLFKF